MEETINQKRLSDQLGLIKAPIQVDQGLQGKGDMIDLFANQATTLTFVGNVWECVKCDQIRGRQRTVQMFMSNVIKSHFPRKRLS